MPRSDKLSVTGANENNLQDLSLEISHDDFVVLTGVSGSGKSTLAFDTLYAEGGRRYIETFSPYTRQFLDRLPKPEIQTISGVRPSLALEQTNRIINARSTVGTVTEVNEYLKLIWSKLATISCPKCGENVERDSPLKSFATIQDKIKSKDFPFLAIAFPASFSGIASIEAFRSTLQSEGFLRYFNEKTKRIELLDELEEAEVLDSIVLVTLDRIKLDKNANLSLSKEAGKRLLTSLRQAQEYGQGRFSVLLSNSAQSQFEHLKFNSELACSTCEISINPPKSGLFSFNNPLGACSNCKGFGFVLELDIHRCIPNTALSIENGAICCWETKGSAPIKRKFLQFCKDSKIPTNKPWNKLSKTHQELVLKGSKKFGGLEGWYKRLKTKQYKMHVRVMLSKYRGQFKCEECDGSRLKKEAQLYKVGGESIPDIWGKTIENNIPFFRNLRAGSLGDKSTKHAISEVLSRLSYLNEIGLGYLTLDRQSRTLSGGESQRVNLTSILGARLVKTLLVLDEPTIGLHAADTYRLIDTIQKLKERGNTVMVVEHDQEVIKAADHVIDLGPESGNNGGKLIYEGSLDNLKKNKNSFTADYLFNGKQIVSNKPPWKPTGSEIKIINAQANNLKNLNITIPLGCLTVLCGVSGSGKTSLLEHCLHQPYKNLKNGGNINQSGLVDEVEGLDEIHEIILVDQSPVGKTPRSNPGTYTKAWDLIRECLEESDAAQALGLNKSSFSFNVDGGRCPDCKGAGYHKVEMQFLADVYVVCESCKGERFQSKVLDVRFHNKNVIDFLNMTIAEVSEFFAKIGNDRKFREIKRKIDPLCSLGLDYLKMGHPLNTLSGGEAQRVKLASYLGEKSEKPCLFILDEPTTGLHPHNISSLMAVFDKLCEKGHSVLVIEHNLDVIASSDWLIELGPGGGEHGGQLICQGSPATLLKSKKNLKKSLTLNCISQSGMKKTPTNSPKKVSLKNSNTEAEAIEITGANHHNLKNVNVAIPQNKIVTISGVSGSGKSSLAFDILFSEGQRRYIDCLSPYARQFMKQLDRAEVDSINLIPPTIAVSQKTAASPGISTVATTTDIYQFLRLLFSKAGVQQCPKHKLEIVGTSPREIAKELIKSSSGKKLFFFASVVTGRKGHYGELFKRALAAEITSARIDNKVQSIREDLKLERHKLHWISLLVGSLKANKKNLDLIIEAIEQCLVLGNGELEVVEDDVHSTPKIFNTDRVCPKCKQGFRQLDPQDFSFRSKRGLCNTCLGRGKVEKRGKISVCKDCNGARISKIGRNVLFSEKTIFEMTQMTSTELLVFLRNQSFEERLDPVIRPILEELFHRLEIVNKVGLDYLELDRDSNSISGGEAQRLRLAKALGSPLSGVCYVLDEPTIGLHPEDQLLLTSIFKQLKDSGNTVVVVEHDEDIILGGDHLIDVGPGGGKNGGRIVYSGAPSGILSVEESVTGAALKEGSSPRIKELKSAPNLPSITISGASANNLKNVEVQFPLERISIVCGVSGAGKSSLIKETLLPGVIHEFENTGRKRGKKIGDSQNYRSIAGIDNLERIIEIDQTPLGKTSTSNPASYLGIMKDIRKLYSLLPEAETRGWKEKHFSFNTGAGRCEFCSGKGFIKIPMSFLPEARTLCEHCEGRRYNPETESLLFNGISIGNLLQKTMSEARDILCNHKRIRRSLDYVHDLGLGYISLGQASHTLSGGEAQRLKIARELGAREAKDTLYILDEPTVGLHMSDVDRLFKLLQKLVTKGNTVVVIEHNLDFIRSADHIIELGEGPGEEGGQIIFSGTPYELSRYKNKTATSRALNGLISQPRNRKKVLEKTVINQ